MHAPLLRRAAPAAFLLAAACSDATGPEHPPPAAPAVASITVSPSQPVLAVGETVQLFAQARDAGGRPVPVPAVQWRTTDAGVATVSATGLVTATGQGEALVVAAAGGRADTALVTVAPPPVAGVDLDVAAVALDEGASQRLVATPRRTDGTPVTGRVVTWSTSDAEVATVGPDGTVTALRPGTATITARVDGRTASAVVTATADHAFDLVYGRWSGVPGEPQQLYLLDLRSPARAAGPVTAAGPGFRPAASPDGRRIAYVVVDAFARTDLRVLDRATGAITILTTGPAADDQPTWSPDGSRIAFRRQVDGEAAHIWVINADGSGAAPLTAGLTGTFRSPAWSAALPGGSRIAYMRSAGGNGHLWTMAPDGTDRRQVTAGAVFDDAPAWSPDGQALAFTRANGPDQDIWLVNANGGGERVLIDLPMHQHGPAWSPDGRQIAFTSRHGAGGTMDVYTVWAAGPARLARRTADGIDAEAPAWVRRP
jgi:dipeptidyl aminopeptidase/acylaminoacyl peptidase